MTIVLELNDWQLRVFNDNSCSYDQPGAAASNNGEIVFGNDALASSRSNPQQFNHKYLHRFSADPLPTAIGSAKNHADLIYHQLKTLGLNQVVASVPTHLNNQQLGLLLGICGQADIELQGFIDQALAYSLDLPIDGNFHVLDLEMHRGYLARIEVDGQRRQSHAVRTLETLGINSIVDGWISVIADEFVQKTRFDPLHTGTAEQQLFNQVWSWAQHPSAAPLGNQHIEVSHSEHTRDIEIAAPLLQDKLQQRLEAADLANLSPLVVTPRCQRVPGLIELLERQGIRVIKAQDHPFVSNCEKLANGLSSEQITRVSSGESHAELPADRPTTPQVEPSATHLLHEHRAYALTDVRFAGRFDTPLSLGTRVTVDDQVYTAIRLE